MLAYPVTPVEFRVARDKGYHCRHPFKGLVLTEEQADPTAKDLLRRKQVFWCEQCKGIKYGIMQGDGKLRSWKNG